MIITNLLLPLGHISNSGELSVQHGQGHDLAAALQARWASGASSLACCTGLRCRRATARAAVAYCGVAAIRASPSVGQSSGDGLL